MQDTAQDYPFRMNRYILQLLGLWPNQTPFFKHCAFIWTSFFLLTQGYFQIGGMMLAWTNSNVQVFLEAAPPVLISIVVVIKYINFMFHTKRMKILLDTVHADFDTTTSDELKILYNWAKDSKKNTIIYAAAVYGSMVPFMIGPLIPLVLEMLPSYDPNTTIPRFLMYNVDYLLDSEKYFFIMLIHSYPGTIIYISVVVGIDTFFMSYVQHTCALFNIIGYRLQRLVDNHDLNIDLYPSIQNDKPYFRIIECIVKHNKTLEYAELIERVNYISFFGQLAVNMICISFTIFQAASRLSHPAEALQYLGFTIAQTSVLFFDSWPSQRLADESIKISEYVTKSTWYLLSMRSRKLLRLLMLRGTVPCILTAGNFYILNLQNFSAVVRTSMSYFTVLYSMQ